MTPIPPSSPIKEAVGPGHIPEVGGLALGHEQHLVEEVDYLGAGLVDGAHYGPSLAGQAPQHLEEKSD